MRKMVKNLGKAVVLGMVLTVPFGGVEAADPTAGYRVDDKHSVVEKDLGVVGAYDIGVDNTAGLTFNFKGDNLNIDITPGTGWGSGNVGIRAANLNSISNIGEKGKTQNITINVIDNATNEDIAVGIWATKHGTVDVNSKNLNITGNSKVSAMYGIYAQNKSDNDTENLATININAENTYVNVTSDVKGNSYGIVAMSQGIVNINGNLEVHADNAIIARGDSVVNVNKNGDKVVKLDGDVEFDFDEKTSGTKADAVISLNLSNKESYWNGNAKFTWTGTPEESQKVVTGLNVDLSNGATWNPTVTSETDTSDSGALGIAINNLDLSGGVINITETGEKPVVKVQNMKGTGGTINVNSLAPSQIQIDNKGTDTALTVAATPEITDALATGAASAQEASKVASFGKDSASNGFDFTSPASAVAGGYDIKVDGGTVVSVKEEKNTTNEGISNLANLAFMSWRAENNDMNKRLGELRASTGEHGVWARMTRGKSEYESVSNQYNSYQLGYDKKIGNKNWTLGAAFTYTDGSNSFENGSGNNKHKGLAIYGSYLGNNGSFLDLIAKYAKIDHDFKTVGGAGNGEYDTKGLSLSAEYGKRFTKESGLWIEPQVELTYGSLGSANFTTLSGVDVHQDGMKSLVGRLGFSLGKNFKQGNAYVRASYLHDFKGDTSMNFSRGGIIRTYTSDLGGSWWEVGLGTNLNLNNNTHLYVDLEKTFGGDVSIPWQWNAGVRWSF